MAKKTETKKSTKAEPKAKKAEAPQAPEEQIAAQDMPITIHAQYVRDMSFENPNAPESLRPSPDAPEMDINIGMDARKIEDPQIANLFEVVLNVRAAALRGEDPVFIAELQYGATVSVGEEVPEDNHHPLLLIEIPRIIFPFVRQIMSDMTVQGGYPPLLLNPVDFHALYMNRFGAEIDAAKDAETAVKN